MTKNILLLQGPMGPFFKRFARDLKEAGHVVFKINFNAGDGLFYHGERAYSYTGTIEDWPEYLEERLGEWQIDEIYLFGNERVYHRLAHELADRLDITVYVFEEGYLRPDYITLEKDGVNGRSSVPRTPEAYDHLDEEVTHKTQPVPYPFYHNAWYATLYYIAGWFGQEFYSHYQHHRPFKFYDEAAVWILSAIRKRYYQTKERRILPILTAKYSKKYFLVPLQVHNDSQIKSWSSIPSTAAFIRRIISSFAKDAPQDCLLVIKHHPLDRGYSNYSGLIERLSGKYRCRERVVYVHDLHLPTLLKHAKGTVMLNSTVGISSLFHGTPVKTMAHAIYDIEGLTFRKTLAEFWQAPGSVDKKMFRRFRNYLLENNQINGNFYRKIPLFETHCGMNIHNLIKLERQLSDKSTVIEFLRAKQRTPDNITITQPATNVSKMPQHALVSINE